MNSNKPWAGFIFDLETGGTNRYFDYSASTPRTIEEFLEISADPARYIESSFFKSTFDRTTGKPFQILEFFGEQYDRQTPFFDRTQEKAWSGFHHDKPNYLQPHPGFQMSEFSENRGIAGRAQEKALINQATGQAVTEEEFVGSIYQQLERQIAEQGKVEMRAWYGTFDLNFIEATTHRYDSLEKYRGFFAAKAKEGVFRYRGLEDEVFQTVFQYGQETPGFADQFFKVKSGAVAKSWQDLRQLPDWSIEARDTLFKQHGPWAFQSAADVGAERFIGKSFEKANELIAGGASAAQAIEKAGILSEGQSVADFMSELLSTPFQVHVQQEIAEGKSLLSTAKEAQTAAKEISTAWPLVGAGILVGAAVALGLAVGKRTDRQTQIEGLHHGGEAGRRRRQNTDFGSGWRGLDENSHNDRAFFGMAALTTAYMGHSWALRNVPDWASKTYKLGSVLETRFPNKILSTFSMSQRASQYLPNQLTMGFGDIFGHLGTDIYGNIISTHKPMGEQLQRLIGPETDLRELFLANRDTSLQFIREDAASPFLRMHINGVATANQVSFAKQGALTASSMRYGSETGKNFYPTGLEWIHQAGNTGQQVTRDMGEVESALVRSTGEAITFQPFMGKTDGQTLRNVGDRLKRETFSLTERMNRLLHEYGHAPESFGSLSKYRMGIEPGQYKTSAELVGKILTKRVLPIAIGLTALKYGDYLTGHMVSNFGWGTAAKARIAHAEATDSVPGARGLTDWYKDHVPGYQYGPIAMPVAGGAVGMAWHFFSKVVPGIYDNASMAERGRAMTGKPLDFLRDLAHLKFSPKKLGPAGAGALIGAAAMLPLIPGMLGSRKTAKEVRGEYSGETPVEVRSGRWWELGATPYGGNRILMRRPHAYLLHKSHAQDVSLYGSEKEKWAHNPLMSPLSWFKDPYYLERTHAQDRPYPAASPAFSNVPWVGGFLAATIGKVVKPPKRLQADKWSGEDYTLFTPQLEPKGPEALAPSRPREEFRLGQVMRNAAHTFSEMIGLPGFVARSAWAKLGPPSQAGQTVYLEGSRAMTNLSRQYYDLEMGAMMGPHHMEGLYGYSEGLRRFIQHDKPLTANELPNQMPSWLPDGNQYFHNFHRGDPYVGIPMGYARLPGAGYEALHPELAGVKAEDYPDIEKLRILADVAPWSSKFKQMSKIVGAQAKQDTNLNVDFQNIVEGAERIRESTVNFTDRHTGETEEVEGTVSEVSSHGVQLNELPGRNFHFSAVSTSAASMSSLALGAGNEKLADISADIERRQAGREAYLAKELKPGTKVHMVVPKGGADVSQTRAVVYAGGTNVNLELANRGFAKPDMEAAGPEVQSMDGPVGRLMRKYAEGLAFSGGEAWYNPMRYAPKPGHTKYWQEREPIEQYLQQEVLGTRKRRWQRPFHDMLQPWLQGAAYRMTGRVIISPEVQKKRDLDTLTDQLAYMRELYGMTNDPEHRGVHSMKAARTAIGSNLSGPSEFLPQTLSNRDRKYFGAFLKESDPERRSKILTVVSKEMSNALQAQWINDSKRIARAEGQDIPFEETNSPEETTTRDFERASEIAEFFHRRGLKLPDADSPIMSDSIDYQDVKLKVIQWEGLDAHDFGIYDDRVAMLARKPYLDGAVRELTMGDDKTVDEMTTIMRNAIAQSKSGDPNADVRLTRHAARAPRRNMQITLRSQPDEEMKQEVRRNPDDYQQ
jgi:hypothetical protein